MYGDWALAKFQSAGWKRMFNITAYQGESYKNPWQNNVSEEYMFLQIIKAPRTARTPLFSLDKHELDSAIRPAGHIVSMAVMPDSPWEVNKL